MFKNKMGTALKSLLESKGEQGTIEVIRNILETKKMVPEDFSIKEIWEACTDGAPIYEAVATGSFPKITGELINSKLIAAYDGVATIGEQLTTTIPSNMQVETFAGFTEVETPEEVGENEEYKDSTFTEKYVTAQSAKYGRLLSVTEEMIYFDKTGQIMARANRIGTKAAQYKEKLIVEGVQDVNTTVHRPSGVPTAFYSATNGNLVATNPFSESGLEAISRLAHIQKDDALHTTRDDYIDIDLSGIIVLIPQELHLEAWQMANSALTPETAENAKNYWMGRFLPLTSPYVTGRSATTWYWGNFNKDFTWVEVWPLQTMSQGAGHEDSFKKDVKARVKVRFYGTIAALDTKHSYKATV